MALYSEQDIKNAERVGKHLRRKRVENVAQRMLFEAIVDAQPGEKIDVDVIIGERYLLRCLVPSKRKEELLEKFSDIKIQLSGRAFSFVKREGDTPFFIGSKKHDRKKG